MKDESAPQEEGAPSADKDVSSALTSSPQNKEDGISGCGASAPIDTKEDGGDAPEPPRASAATSAASPSAQSTDATKGGISACSEAASTDTDVKTKGTSGATSNSNLRDASYVTAAMIGS